MGPKHFLSPNTSLIVQKDFYRPNKFKTIREIVLFFLILMQLQKNISNIVWLEMDLCFFVSLKVQI